MKPPVFDYRAPRTPEETLALLAEYADDGRILAGGQSLMPLLNFRMARPSVLIDLNRCADLDYIRVEDAALVIGPMMRQANAERHPLVFEHCPLLAQALPYMGHLTIRNRGTVGGSLAHADPCAELPTVAFTLDAELIVEGVGGRRSLTPGEFFTDSLVTAIEPGEMLREVRFPIRRKGDRHAFAESGVRRADLAIAGVTACIHVTAAGLCEKARLVALGGGPIPVRLIAVESLIEGRHIGDVDIAEAAAASHDDVDPPSDLQAGSEYRRDLIVSLARDALQSVCAHESGAIA
jgi:CO/xanthine dehydrogenase FAD-binding subunit